MIFYETDFLKNEEIILKLSMAANGDISRGLLPTYYFYICDNNGTRVGVCELRVGYNEKIYVNGNIGYFIFRKYRGHHYAAKACKLLFGLAKKHDMDYVIITCDVDNYASRKTCEFAGGVLKKISEKCIYYYMIN